jgi:hypothetical protein
VAGPPVVGVFPGTVATVLDPAPLGDPGGFAADRPWVLPEATAVAAGAGPVVAVGDAGLPGLSAAPLAVEGARPPVDAWPDAVPGVTLASPGGWPDGAAPSSPDGESTALGIATGAGCGTRVSSRFIA